MRLKSPPRPKPRSQEAPDQPSGAAASSRSFPPPRTMDCWPSSAWKTRTLEGQYFIVLMEKSGTTQTWTDKLLTSTLPGENFSPAGRSPPPLAPVSPKEVRKTKKRKSVPGGVTTRRGKIAS